MTSPIEIETEGRCVREGDGPCFGERFSRTSSSGLTVATYCERHALVLDAQLAKIAERYPEINHPDGCGCWGCSEGSY